MKTAGIIIIGNEILSGKVTDINSPYLCQELRPLGVEVKQIITIPDIPEIIGRTVVDFSERFTWVFTSGGIGPTHDDITVASIANGFGIELFESPLIMKVIRNYHGDKMTSAHRRMAMIPEGSELIEYAEGRGPQLQFRNIFVFPGIPEFLKIRFSAIKERFRTTPIVLKQIYLKADEGVIAESLDATQEAFPELMLGSYPKVAGSDYDVKLTLECRDSTYLEKAFDFLYERLPEKCVLRIE
ncbi:MAG: competence/damage-inducible protein A [SAR324 cluster bacterium]|nr:competence/damage-inducible protein A [SAR324 cluster bacterium]